MRDFILRNCLKYEKIRISLKLYFLFVISFMIKPSYSRPEQGDWER